MGCAVYANGMAIACKVADGKSAAAMPDVCLSPPSPPAGPIPIPYPNTAMASDTDNGSKTVQIGGDEVMLKDQSTFKKSTGDEAATKSLGMGVVSHQIGGEVNFCAWSMDVKFEGLNVPRHLDLMLHNEMCVPSNTGPWPYIDSVALPKNHPCKKDETREQRACKDVKNPCSAARALKKPSGFKKSPQANRMADRTAASRCLAARRCKLQPYDRNKTKCCPGQTPHHLIEASAFFDTGRGGKGSVSLDGVSGYSEGNAPCVCVEGKNQNTGTHKLMHTFQSQIASKCKSGKLKLSDGGSITAKKTTFGKAKNGSVRCMKKVFPESKCSPGCIKAQLNAYHSQCGIDDGTPVKAVETGDTTRSAARGGNQEITDRSARVQAARATGLNMMG
jgi:hypothetical protein